MSSTSTSAPEAASSSGAGRAACGGAGPSPTAASTSAGVMPAGSSRLPWRVPAALTSTRRPCRSASDPLLGGEQLAERARDAAEAEQAEPDLARPDGSGSSSKPAKEMLTSRGAPAGVAAPARHRIERERSPTAATRRSSSPSVVYGASPTRTSPPRSLQAEQLDQAVGVEVAVPGEEAAGAERAAGLAGLEPVERERDGGRARAALRRPVERDAGDAGELLAQPLRQRLLVGLAGQHAGDDRPAPALQAGGQAVVHHRHVALAEVGDEVDGRGRPGHALVVQRAGLPHVRRVGLLGGQAQRLSTSRGLAARVHEPDVRAEELVGGAEQEVAADGPDVDRAVQRVVHRVDDAQRAGLARQRRGARDVVDGADGVGRVADGDDASSCPARRASRTPPSPACTSRGPRATSRTTTPRSASRSHGPRLASWSSWRDHHFVAGLEVAREGAR